MTTTGVANFNPTVVEIAEEAFERIGKELRTGYDLRTARRSLNILGLEWANRGVNLWTVDERNLTIVPGTQQYALPDDTIDVIEGMCRTGSGSSQFDQTMTRISVSDWAQIPNKGIEAKPLQYYINRLVPPLISLWPVPDDAQPYLFVYWALTRIEDASTSGGSTTLDLPSRFIPAMISGLAVQLAMKNSDPNVLQRLPLLKAQYDEEFTLAATEDRDRASLYIVPNISFYGR